MTNENNERICPSCGKPFGDSNFCPNCGNKFENVSTTPIIIDKDATQSTVPNQQIPQAPSHNKKNFYETNWFIILLLIFFFPVGLFLMWKYSKWHKAAKIVITILLALSVIGTLSDIGNALVEPDTQIANIDDSSSSDDQATADNADQVVEDTSANVDTESEKPAQNDISLTLGQRNALQSAKDYLDYSSFSRSGLIEQLEFEDFSTEDSTYAVDHCGADWNEQAALMAQDYLDYSSFSRSGLIEQLEFEGFTSEQAEYGVKAVGY